MNFKIKIPFILFIFFLLSISDLFCQIQLDTSLCAPLDIPLFISGNFGELRFSHFHTGIDFKTQSKTGFKVYAADKGYVSRIAISSSGFGHAIYIAHPNGFTTVYGHLLGFREDIEQYVKSEQYKRKKFALDLTFKPNEIPIKKGDFIAYSGNTGMSMGPHLHFELRKPISQNPVNVFQYSHINIKDTIAPVVEGIWLYPMNNQSSVLSINKPFQAFSTKGSGNIIINKPIIAEGRIGIGILTHDETNNSPNPVGTYSIELFDNNKLILKQVFNELTFLEVGYLKSLIDYEGYKKNRTLINRLFVEPNNKLSIYKVIVNNGLINIKDTTKHHILIKITDDYKNYTECRFVIALDNNIRSNLTVRKEEALSHYQQVMHYEFENSFIRDSIRLFIPKNALYDDFNFTYSSLPAIFGYFSPIYKVHNPYTALHIKASLSVKPNNLNKNLFSKALLVNLDEQGKILWAGGSYKNNFVTANISSFGDYAISVDTVAPEIIPISIKPENTNLSDSVQVVFFIKDTLSGLSTYTGYIDENWALFEYDAKSDMVFYKFDSLRMKFGSRHKLVLTAIDEKGNKAVYRSEFFK